MAISQWPIHNTNCTEKFKYLQCAQRKLDSKLKKNLLVTYQFWFCLFFNFVCLSAQWTPAFTKWHSKYMFFKQLYFELIKYNLKCIAFFDRLSESKNYDLIYEFQISPDQLIIFFGFCLFSTFQKVRLGRIRKINRKNKLSNCVNAF